jgi:Sap, sulfolipid-1-addressing protein
MPSQALALALAASIYPPAVAAVIALGRGAEVRSRVFAFVFAAALTTYAVGVVILLLLIDLGVSGSTKWTPSAAIELALGMALLLLALRLRSKGRGAAAETPSGAEETSSGAAQDASDEKAPSKIERYLESRRLAFVLGVTLYVLPSPIYIGAVKAIADAKLSTANELLDLLAVVAVMLWMIELPMAMLLALPARAASALEAANLWFARHGRLLAVLAAAGAGAYLAIRGLLGLLS